MCVLSLHTFALLWLSLALDAFFPAVLQLLSLELYSLPLATSVAGWPHVLLAEL